jgi:hypothetical protein
MRTTKAARQDRPAHNSTRRLNGTKAQSVTLGPALEALLRRRLNALAADVGRLSRHLADDSYSALLAARVADGLQDLDCLTQATAAEMFRAGLAFGLEEEQAVAAALNAVDERDRELRNLLGGGARR